MSLPLIILLVFTLGCTKTMTPEESADELEKLFLSTVQKNSSIRNAVFLADIPDLGIHLESAAGIADETVGKAMTPETPFISASIGKMFTAAVLFSLVDQGVISLDDPITDWLPPETLSGLPIEGGDDALQDITIAMLLGHRSGLPDYFEGKTKDGEPTVLEQLNLEPNKIWTVDDLLDYTKDHYESDARPGEEFHYADTNYDLLGLIIEEAAGRPLHVVQQERVWDPLGLDSTWMHSRMVPPRADLRYADVWTGEDNSAYQPSMSLDWAGGGLATTTDDLNRFIRSVAAGSPMSYAEMSQDVTENAIAPGIDYGYSVWILRPEILTFGFMKEAPLLWGVSGSTGSFVYYIPEYDGVLAGTFNQRDMMKKHIIFLIRAVMILEKTDRESIE